MDQAIEKSPAPTQARAEQEEQGPLSFSQEAFWFMDQFQGADQAYIAVTATRIAGSLDVRRLEGAVRALVARHAALRTLFVPSPEGVAQTVLEAEAAAARLPWMTARAEQGERDGEGLARLIEGLVGRGFKLDRELPFRAACIDLGQGEAVLALAVHHMVSDGTSMGIMHRDLAALYASGHMLQTLPESAGSLLAHARAQRERAHTPSWQGAQGYWHGELAGVRDLCLPTDWPRPGVSDFPAGSLRTEIPLRLVEGLRDLARRNGASRFRAWLSVFQALLARVGDGVDFAVGIPVSLRKDESLRETVGNFINTLAIRMPDGALEGSFHELLVATASKVARAVEHADYPFEQVVAELRPERSPERNPLYQAYFALHNLPDQWQVRLPGLECSRVSMTQQRVTLDLLLGIEEHDQGAMATWQYRADLFSASTIARLARQFDMLLEGIVAEPSRPLRDLALFDTAERDDVLRRFALGAPAIVPFVPVHEQFRQQCLQSPDAVALRWNGRTMRYGELGESVNGWAATLRQMGAGPGGVVALCMPRGFAEVVGLMAILEAGAAFLPLDPDNPEQRLRDILDDAKPALALAHPETVERLRRAANAATRVLEIPEDGRSAEALDTEPARVASRPDNLAYVIFTSGSTGRPKGTLIEHRGLSNHVEWVRQALQATPRDRFLQNVSLAFDGSLSSFFVPLACGARVILVDAARQKDMELLHRLMLDEEATTAMLVPSVLRALLEHATPSDSHALRYVVCGGEALDSALARKLFDTYPGVRLGNFYGPTEATVVSVALEVQASDLEGATVPIGRPTAGLRAYVLAPDLQPQPIGVAGELCLGGVGLARGYLNRPQLDAERFVPDPFHPGERLYRSGDLARWRADGKLEFLGRGDDQVKLRGLRVELGEIEAALLDQPQVRGAVVAIARNEAGAPRLVAYVLARGLDAATLRERLKARIPSYMVPSSFMFLDAFPSLPSGKVDRKALALLEPTPDRSEDAQRLAPRSALEANLLEIWQRVLGVTRIASNDDFFALGGNSLQLTQVASQMRAALGVNIELRTLFDRPTLRELTQAVEATIGARGESGEDVPIAKVARDGALALSFSQRRMWLEHQMDPRGGAYNVYGALRLHGVLDRSALRRALDRLVARHEAFRTRFSFEAGEPVARIDPPAPARFTEVDATAGAPPEHASVEAWLSRLAAEPFDLEHGLVYRVILAREAAERHVCVVVMHHIVTDGWSQGILATELEELYRAEHLGQPARLASQGIEFADYACWQRRHVNEDSLQPQVAYWLERLDGMVPLSLPTDTGRATRSGSRGDLVLLPLSEDWIAQLQQRSARLGCTPFMLLLAVFQSMLARWCGQDDVSVGFPIANRTRLEAEGIVGSLVNTLVMRNRVDGAASFRAFLHDEVRPGVLGAFTHQDLPYDNLINRLRERAAPGDDPGIRVLFNVLNSPRAPLHFEGLDAQYVDLGLGSTQFDLSLGIDPVSQKALGLSYSTELFERSSMEGLARLFLHGVERALSEPDCRLEDLWVAPAEDQARIAGWNAPPAVAAAMLPANLPRLLAASRSCTGPALRDSEGRTWSYPELWAAVDAFAGVLRARGAHRGRLVGLGLPRGAELVIAQLATLEAGAAYVPLDPRYPQARLHDMIEDAGLLLLVTTSELHGVWEGADVQLLDIGTATGSAATVRPDPDDELAARPEDPAYVIYTSGSTGKPKGVVVPHHAVVNFLVSMQREPGLRQQDTLLAVTTLSFDIAVLELLLPVSLGACVAVASHEEVSDGGALLRRIEREQPAAMQATPATWRMLIDAGWRGTPGLKALVGGEALGRGLADEILARCAELWNMYGPTETTVWSTCWRVAPTPAPIRIGTPIANTQIHVLDAHGRPCPIGFSGEVFIGGEGVTSGYLHRAELTAERFVPNPFAPVAGATMYRTGDRGRWGHDGLLEHQGRLDFQVKVRGFRIELGEIESHLQAHEDVAQCLTLVREDFPGDPRLTAYVVPRGAQCDPAALRDWLRARLPAYMVPQQIVRLAEFPRLPNGKINRALLPRPTQEAPGPGRGADDAPRTETERALAGIWSTLLGASEVRRGDNFFDLGGHSLLANRVVVEFEKLCGARLDLRRLVHENLAQLTHGVDESAMQGTAEPQASGPESLWHSLRRRLWS